MQLVRSRPGKTPLPGSRACVLRSELFPSYTQETLPVLRSPHRWNTRQMVPRAGLGAEEESALTWDAWGALLGRVRGSAGKRPSA